MFFVLFSFLPIRDAYRLIKKIDKGDSKETEIAVFLKFFLIALIGFWTCAFFGNRYMEFALYAITALIVAIKRNILAPSIS